MAPPPSQKERGKKNLESAEWYHGFRPKKDACRLVNEPGEFLVRATDTGSKTDVVITACDDNRKKVNLVLTYDGTNWHIKQTNSTNPIKTKFPTIVELVEHYRTHPPSKHLRLSKAILRPEWMLKHENVIYEEKDKLGQGNFCSVYKGLWKRGGDVNPVAVKISQKAMNATDAESEDAKEARIAMMHEAHIMSFFAHEHVVSFFGVACDHQPVLVVMEFCAGGDLLTHLIKQGRKTEDLEKLVYLFEGSRGMLYLHSKKCVHRDLAARNCLISSTGRIKIADFGLSKLIDDVEPEGETNSSNAQVPVRWMAPETLRKPPVYSHRSGVWAFGVMAYEIFNNGVKPWPDEPVKYVATQIRKGNMPKLPESTPCKVVDLVSRMWNTQADKRPRMRAIAKELCSIIKEITTTQGAVKHDNLTINQIMGVARDAFFEFDDSSEFESHSTCDSDYVDVKGEKNPGVFIRKKPREPKVEKEK
ncbi:hypothetical protein PFISCL1PPCAC_20220 [Pristionchus fissidentatus]|uniref:Tyrosine-protein kinase n=1 Tax=Pristionchus fissidentatus TaxID=1538716 RepID=A0AAV5WBK6_9BILA|nr:hypothetical protein PFISCL1PPCAC_20220 [Pristionchus fissidentatus]